MACAAVAMGATSCAEKKNEIKVISYNVRVSGGDGENHWDKRKHASINMINDEKPTVFGVQEAKPDQMAYLVENLPQYGYIGVGREDGVASGEHMTIFLIYPFIKLGAKLYGKFDLEETTPKEAVAKSKTPIVFIHGDTDDFVPHSMSVECFNACKSQKKLVTIEGAGHGLAFPVNQRKYVESLRDFQHEANLFNK